MGNKPIEELLYSYLKKGADVQVYLMHPEKPQKSYIVFEKTGSSNKNYCKSATIAIQSYGGTLKEALQLNEKIKILMNNFITLDEIVNVTLDNDYNFTDTTTKQYRYQAVYTIKYY